jgi:hypothetical protein
MDAENNSKSSLFLQNKRLPNLAFIFYPFLSNLLFYPINFTTSLTIYFESSPTPRIVAEENDR